MKTLNPFLKIIFVIFLFNSTLFSQLELSTYTNKDNYNYGETIELFCKVKNRADTTFEFFAPTYQSCQAEFSFNDFNSWEYNSCLATTELLTFEPHAAKIYSWIIEPQSLGLPNKDGTQTIIGHYYFDLKDTIQIESPLFLGGEISVGYQNENADSIQWIKDSLDINVIEHDQFENRISEKWEISGYQIDSVLKYLNSTALFLYTEKAVFVDYDSIIDENPLDYYPLHIGDKWYYDVKYIPGWSIEEFNYILTKEVIKDTILSNGKMYLQIKELRSDTSLVKYSYERIDSLSGRIYQYSESVANNEFIQFDLISPINQPFITMIEFYSQQTTELMYLNDQGQEDIFNSQLTNIGYRDYSANSNNNSYGVSHKLNENIGRTFFEKYFIDGFDEYHYLKAAYINGVKYGDTTLVGVNDRLEYQIPTQFSLSQNYPNPFNPTTTIGYSIPSSSVFLIPTRRENNLQDFSSQSSQLNGVPQNDKINVALIVYDVLGRKIKTLVNQQQNPGKYSVQFDGSDLVSGIYYYRLTSRNFSETKKLILLK